MTFRDRLGRLEREASMRRFRHWIAEVDRRLDGAGADCRRLFVIRVRRVLFSDAPSLPNLENWLAGREAAEPGFTERIEGELRRRGVPLE